MIRLTRAASIFLGSKVSGKTIQIPKSVLSSSRQLCNVAASLDNVEPEVAELESSPQEVETSGQLNKSKSLRRVNINFNTKVKLLQQLEILEGKDNISAPAVYRFLISCGQDMYAEAADTRTKLVEEVWNRFKAKGVELDVSHYNALLTAYIHNEHNFAPMDFLADMQSNGIKPNFITFLHLVRAYSSRADMQGALKVIEFMNKENFRLSEAIYACLIEGYGKAGDMNNAAEVLEIMNENDCPPGVRSYGALLGGYARQGNMEKVDEIFQDMEGKKIVPDSSAYITIVDNLSQGGHSDLVKEVLQKIEDKDDFRRTARDLIKVLISRGDNVVALELATFLDSLNATDGEEGPFNVRSFVGNLYTASSSADNFLSAMKLLEEKGLTETPIEDTLDYCYWRKNPAGALKMIKELRAAGRPVKIHYFYPVVKTLADNKDFEGLRDTINVLGNLKTPVDDSLFRFVKQGLGDLDGLDDIITALVRESGLEMPPGTAADLFDSAIKSEDVDKVLSVLPAMSYRQIIEGDKFSRLESLIKSSFQAEKAAQMYKIMNDKKILRIGSSIGRVLDHVTSEESSVEGKDAVKFVKDLIEGGVKNMNSKVYTKALAVIYRDKLKDDFFEIVRLMKQHDIQADEHQYIQMLKMSSYIGNSAAAQFCFDKIKQSTITPNANMYSNLIAAYWADRSREGGGLQEENILQITNTYEAMKEQDMKPPAGIISSIAIAYLGQQRIDEADEFVKEMGAGNRPLFVYNAYLRAYSKVGRIEDAEKLLEWMKTAEDAPRPTHGSYHSVMSGYRVEGNVARVEELMEEMKSQGMTPIKVTNMELVKSYLEKRDMAGALDCLEKIDNADAYPYEVLYRRILRDLRATNDITNLQRAKGIFEAQGCLSPSACEIDSLSLFLLVKSGRREEAIALLKSDDFRGTPIEVKQIAAEAMGDMSHLESVKAVFTESGEPTYVFDHALLRHYGRTNNVDKALKLYKEKIESGQEIVESFQSRLEEIVRANNRDIPSHPVYFGRRALAFVEGMLSAYLKL